MTSIKDWKKFQHFKDRRPPWVKLYRDILDDPEWHELDAQAAKVLVMLWLIASEYDGNLPDIKKLSFRLRMSESKTLDALSKLSHWLDQSDIDVISGQHQVDAPETETEGETKKRQIPLAPKGGDVLFEKFWEAYPSKVGKDAARKAWAKRSPDEALLALMLTALDWQRKRERWVKDNGQYIPNPSTWLNAGQWQDVRPDDRSITVPGTNERDPALRKLDEDRLKTGKPAPEIAARLADITRQMKVTH